MDSQSDFLIQALRLAAIVEGSDDAIVSKDVNGIVTSWNAAAERMFGYSAAEVIGRSIRLIIPDDRQSEEDVVLSRIRAGERVDHFETQRCRKNGELFDVSITVSPIRTPDGRVIGASKIARDISERRRNERALLEARAEHADLRRRLSTIIDASSALLMSPRLEDVLPAILVVAKQVLPADGFAVWRREEGVWSVIASEGLSDRFISVSIAPADQQQLTELLVVESVRDAGPPSRIADYAEEGVESMLVVPLHTGPDMTASIAFYYRMRHQFTTVERESALGLGRLASSVISTARLYDSQRRRRIESDFIAEAGALLVSSLDYRDTLTLLAERAVPRLAEWCAFHMKGDEGRVELVASSATRSDDEPDLERFVAAGDGEPEDVFSVERVIRTGQATMLQRWSADECDGWAQARVEAAARVGVGSVVCVPLVARSRTLGALTIASLDSRHPFTSSELGFAQDLAYRVALSIDNIMSYEDARTANRLKDEFLANLSHELRTPLNAIVGYAQMLKKGALPEARKPRAYEVLDKNASALTQIVEDVLDISRIISGKIRLQLHPVQIEPIVQYSVETVQPGADAKGVRIQVESERDLPTVAGDADRLQQVVWNLLSNAIKFTPRDGRITVKVRGCDGGCEVCVADNGAGIDPLFLPHIFERFRQGDTRHGREHGGLGLGLSIARQIVEMHGGTISAESPGLGQGSIFRVVLPALSR
jgi:PAS domain S-box-containing protein